MRNSEYGTKAPMVSVTESVASPGKVIAVDLVGPSSLFDGGVALTCIDLYSRFPLATLLKDGSAREVTKALQQIFSLFGASERLISDNGASFRSQEMAVLLKQYGVTHSFSSVYYPQANGVVERFHRRLKSRMGKLRSEHPQQY
jgi:transposase InsO family protein